MQLVNKGSYSLEKRCIWNNDELGNSAEEYHELCVVKFFVPSDPV